MIKESSGHVYRTTIPTALVLAVVSLAFVSIGNAQSQKFQFGVIGDTSYSKVAEQEFDRMMAALNKETLAFVVHVGDFEADPNPYERSPDKITMPCTDENFQRVLATFQKSANPFILTPGDNDWSDCIKLKARSSIRWNAWPSCVRCFSLKDVAWARRLSLLIARRRKRLSSNTVKI